MNTRNQQQQQPQQQKPALATRPAGGGEQSAAEPVHRGVVGRYLTRSGNVGAEIRRNTHTYSYIGAWGAGGGHCLGSMRAMLELMLRNRRGWSVEIPFPSEPQSR